MRNNQAITKYQRFKRGGGGRTHIISSQIVNHQAPNFQRTLGRCWKTMFGQPTKKSRKNAINLLPDFRTNPKVCIHPDLKIFTTPLPHLPEITFLHIAKNSKPYLPYKWSPAQAWKATPRKLSHEMQKGSIGHTTPIIILDLLNVSQAP